MFVLLLGEERERDREREGGREIERSVKARKRDERAGGREECER